MTVRTASAVREPPPGRILASAGFKGGVDVQRDRERRRDLAAFLQHKRQRVDVYAKQVGPYVRRENRIGRAFTQEEVAEALDVSRQWYAALEIASAVRPSPTLLDRIATLFALDNGERATLFRLAIRELGYYVKPAGTILDSPSPRTAYVAEVQSPAEIDRAAYALARIRDQYHGGGLIDVSAARPRILASWNRCRDLGVDPNLKRPPMYHDPAELRAANERLLRAADAVLVNLADQFAGTGYIIIVTDAEGRLLELAGDLDTRRQGERYALEPGGEWSEAAAGTNGIGTALADRRPMQLIAGEHFCDAPQPFTCTAAPIWAPKTREIVGVLDMSASYQLARPHLVGVVMQAALEIEERLALL